MRPGTEIFSDADGRSTERESREHIVRHTVPNGGSGDWEGPAADGRQFHGRGTSRRFVREERSERRPGRLATRTS